ncbi:MAG: hypothetical protein JNJ85_17175 [Candidatus Kapabacteria bacterium]|nr:hypothetical protein [Candidatus Kapabacteria bacterium]
MNILVQSWNDLPLSQPVDIRGIVANAVLGVATGDFTRSTTFLQSSWGTNAIVLTGSGMLQSLDPTDAKTVIDAQQWTVAHKMINTSSSLAPTMRRIMFLRAGEIWSNNFQIALGATNYTDIQLSLRDNLGTSGLFLGSGTPGVPVLAFSGVMTGNVNFNLTVKQAGTYSMVLVVKDNGTGVYSTFEMEWVVM